MQGARATPSAPLPLEQAQARLLALAAPLPGETLAVADAAGRYLAEPLVARRTQPAADLSAMDGYALRAADLPGPWQVVGESAAGHPWSGTVGGHAAVRISTGAVMPAESDMVLLQEDAERRGNQLILSGTPPRPPQRHVRRRGNDFHAGETLCQAGTRMVPAPLALAIAAGHAQVAVHGLPTLAVLDTGDELASTCNADLHQVPASNGPMVAAMAAGLVRSVHRLGPVPDRLDALAAALAQAGDADVLVTSGGASVGDHDLVRPALETWGATVDFWRVAIKPGKPILVARRGRQVILGLPGNPVSCFVTAWLFLLPLLRHLAGASAPLPRPIMLPLGTPLPPGGKRREFLRAAFDGASISPLANQDSGALSALAASNALIDRPANAPALDAGTMVHAYLLQNGGIA